MKNENYLNILNQKSINIIVFGKSFNKSLNNLPSNIF